MGCRVVGPWVLEARRLGCGDCFRKCVAKGDSLGGEGWASTVVAKVLTPGEKVGCKRWLAPPGTTKTLDVPLWARGFHPKPLTPGKIPPDRVTNVEIAGKVELRTAFMAKK